MIKSVTKIFMIIVNIRGAFALSNGMVPPGWRRSAEWQSFFRRVVLWQPVLILNRLSNVSIRWFKNDFSLAFYWKERRHADWYHTTVHIHLPYVNHSCTYLLAGREAKPWTNSLFCLGSMETRKVNGEAYFGRPPHCENSDAMRSSSWTLLYIE